MQHLKTHHNFMLLVASQFYYFFLVVVVSTIGIDITPPLYNIRKK